MGKIIAIAISHGITKAWLHTLIVFACMILMISLAHAQSEIGPHLPEKNVSSAQQNDFQKLFEAGRGRYVEEDTPPEQIEQKLDTRYIALVINEGQTSYTLGPYFYILPDPNKRYLAQDILEQAQGFSLNTRNTRDIVNLGYEGQQHWLILRALNNSDQRQWLMDFGNTFEGRYGFAKSLRVYSYTLKNNSEETIDPELIRIVPLTETGYFDLDLAKDKETLILIAVDPLEGVPLSLNPNILTKDALLEKKEPLFTPLSLLMIFLSGMVFFCLSLSLSKRSAMYLPFATYYFLLGLVLLWNNAHITGLVFMEGKILPLLTAMIAVCSIGLTKIFLNIRQYDYTERYFINGLGLLIFVASMAALLPLPMPPVIRTILFYGPTILTFIGLPLLCFAQTQAGKNEAAPLIWAWLFILAGLIISGSSLSGTLTLTDVTLNGFWIMLAPQAVFFIVAMMKKINLEEDQIFEEKAQANKETLSLVRLRHTKESAEQARLLKVIEKERQLLAQLREREARRTEEMRKAKEFADEANRAKSAFLAVVSHEVRTPMTGIMGMVRLLLDGQLSKEQKDYVQTIQESGDAMLTLLNDILDFEKIERGKMEIEQIPFDLSRIIQGVSTLMSGHAALKNIQLKTEIDENVPASVIGDPNRLRQVLLNLTGNAIKFTSEGSVIIRISAQRSENGFYQIRFAVKDSGIGISPDGLKNLFTPFAQANTSITRKYGGTGLGLAICKGLVDAMGSEIKVSSKEGEGSIFHFTLEMRDADEHIENIPEILNPNLEIEEHDGLQTEIVQEDSPDNHEAADREETDLPPLEKINLLETPPRIMVVDDNEVNLKVIIGFLKKINCKTKTLENAEDLLKQLEASEDAPYDILLMDIQLPRIKGDEAARRIRAMENPAISGMPIIALSGNTSEEDKERYYAAGITDFVPKPIDHDILIETIAKVLTGETKSIKRSEQTETIPEQDEKIPQMENIETIFDADTLSVLKDNLGKDQLDELLSGLLDKTHEIISAMIEAKEKGDKEAINARAHELKGMAGNFGLIEVTEMSMRAERILKGQEEGDINDHIGLFPDAVTRAESALKQWMDS